VASEAGSSNESLDGLSIISDAAVLTQAVKKINKMVTTSRSLACESWTRDQEVSEREESLGGNCCSQGTSENLYDEVEEL